MKIATLTLSPALDKSSTTERLVPEQKMRCTEMRIDAGGGGINVSKGIRKLDGQSIAVFPSGGHNGRMLQALLKEAGIRTTVVKVTPETRENISITDTSSNQQYRFTLPGTELKVKEADACLDIIKKMKPAYLVASGSLPPGLPEDYYERIARFAHQIEARFILDTSGKALAGAADEGVFLLKPNLAELSALVGVKHLEMDQVDDAALELIGKGKCEVVAVSLGSQGCLLATADGFEHIPAPTVKKQSTVGAGDSMVAGMVWSLSQGKSYLEMAQLGVACGSAATMNSGTELFHAKDAMRLYKWIQQYGKRYQFKEF